MASSNRYKKRKLSSSPVFDFASLSRAALRPEAINEQACYDGLSDFIRSISSRGHAFDLRQQDDACFTVLVDEQKLNSAAIKQILSLPSHRSGLEGQVIVPVEWVPAFELLTFALYHDKLPKKIDRVEDDVGRDLVTLSRAWTYAFKIGMPKLGDVIMVAVCDCLRRDSMPTALLEEIFHTHGLLADSPLVRLAITDAAWTLLTERGDFDGVARLVQRSDGTSLRILRDMRKLYKEERRHSSLRTQPVGLFVARSYFT